MHSKNETLGIYRNIANLQEFRKKYPVDRLKLLMTLTLDLMNFPPVRWLLNFVFCEYLFSTCLAIYHILDRFDSETLLKYGSFCGMELFVTINLGSITFMADTIYEFLEKYRVAIFPAEMMNEPNFKKVLTQGRLLKVICFLNMLCGFIAGLGFIMEPEYFDEKAYICVWIKSTFPSHASWMLWVVHWMTIVVSLVMAGCPVAWAYAISYALTSLYFFKEMIETIPNSSIPQKMRRESEVYQEIVKQKMIMCSVCYQEAIKFKNLARKTLEVPITSIALGSLILGGSLMLEFLSNQEQNFGDSMYAMYVGIFFFSISSVITANLYLGLAQAVKDEAEGCNYLLRQLPWYDMNEENKKIYAMFVFQTEKPIVISSPFMDMDYLLLVKICKALYSMAALLAQFVSSHGKHN